MTAEPTPEPAGEPPATSTSPHPGPPSTNGVGRATGGELATHARPLPALPATILAVTSGVFYWAAFPGTDVWPFAFVCWAPLLIALRGQWPRRALWLGALQGLTCNVLGFYWLLGMLKTFSGFPTVVCGLLMVLLCGYQGGRMAFMSWLYARAERRGWPAGVVFVCAFVASELVYPLLFPWYTGAQTHQVPLLMQLAELGGPIAIGVALAGGSIALAEVVWARREGRPLDRVRVGLGAVGPIVLVAYGAIRLPSVRAAMAAAPKAKVALVQGNLALAGTEHRDSAEIHRSETARLEATEHPDLVVWSETAVNFIIPEKSIELAMRQRVLNGYSEDGRVLLHTPLLTGAIIQRGGTGRGAGKLYNSAVLIDTNGKMTGVYDKTYLLAFGEYLPFGDVFPKLYEWSPNSGALTRGTSLEAIPFGQHRITTLICYEDILPTFTNGAVRHGDPDLLVNITNDAWFGRTTEPAIHLALAKYRAVEHRRYLVRATNSGVSAFIDPTGASSGETPLYEQTSRVGEIAWMRARTPYEVIGDVPWWLATVGIAAMGFITRHRRAGA